MLAPSWVAPDEVKAFGHALECALCAVHSRQSLSCDTKESLRTSATLGRGVAELGFDVTFRFQAAKRGIDGTDGDLAAGTPFDFPPYRDPICLVSKTQKGKDDDMFEFAKIVATGH